MTVIRISLPGRPTTKKNSPSVVPIVSMKGLQDLRDELGRMTCHRDGVRAIMRMVRFPVQPSESYQNWLTEILLHRTSIQSVIRAAGVELPIAAPVAIAATIYRESAVGDWGGYADAIADALQAEVWQCTNCRKKTYNLGRCIYCQASIAKMKQVRQGLGLIEDDKQIVHWDGSRLAKDAKNPRIELALTILDPTPPQPGLFVEELQEVEL